MFQEMHLDSKHLFGDMVNPEYRYSGKEGFHYYWECPESFGNGFVGVIRLKPGVFLGIGDYRIMKAMCISFAMHKDYFNFEFVLRGNMWGRLASGHGKARLSHSPGRFTISYFPGWTGTVWFENNTCAELVSILLTPGAIRELLGNDEALLPEAMKKIVCRHEREAAFYASHSLTGGLEPIVREILYCPYTGAVQRIFLEAKTLELFSMVLGCLAGQAVQVPNPARTGARDIETAHHIKSILEQNLQDPPSLETLARTAGVSHPKLNCCFKKVYGKTVFEYLRDTRLRQAKVLLDRGKMNVTEVAFEVGYSSLSYFTKSFRQQFGCNPGAYLKNPFNR